MLKVGVVGAGTMGKIHSKAYLAIENAELAGIADIRPEVAQPFAESLGIPAYPSMEELIEQENPDILDICLPTYLHKEYVIKAASLGKHVICEKPIARSLEDAKAMIEACRAAGVKLMIGHVLRFFPEYRKAKQMVDRQAAGEIGTVRTTRGGSFPTAWEDWYADPDKSGSVPLDLIIHDFDWLRWTFGEVERVYAKGIIGPQAARMDQSFVSLRFKNGVIAHVHGSWAYPEGFRTELEIAGRKGIITYDSETAAPLKTQLRGGTSGAQTVVVPESPLDKSPYLLELEHFIDCVKNNADPCISPEDAYKAAEISLAALESIRTGQPVTLTE